MMICRPFLSSNLGAEKKRMKFVRDVDMLTANQRVSIKQLKSGNLLISSLRNGSTPGVIQRCTVNPTGTYNIVAIGLTKSIPVRLWIGDYAKNTLYLSKDSFNSDENYSIQGNVSMYEKRDYTTLQVVYKNPGHKCIYIGALFDHDVRVGDQMILNKLSITLLSPQNKLCAMATEQQPAAPLNSQEQKYTQMKIEKAYEKYWMTISTLLSGEDSLMQLWHKIVDFEYKETRRTCFYYENDQRIEYTGDPQQFYQAIYFSREPLLKTIEEYTPDIVVELGAGWGKNLFFCYLFNKTPITTYYGLELTQGGVNVMYDIYNRFCSVGCNQNTAQSTSTQFNSVQVTPAQPHFAQQITAQPHSVATANLIAAIFDLEMPNYDMLPKRTRRMLVCSFWSIKEVTYLNKMVLYKLFDMADEIIGVHLEPIGWQISGKGEPYTHFNRNFYPILLELQAEKRIEMLEIRIDMIGFFSQPNTGTLIIWKTTSK